jgi:hypothetical protein
MPSVRGQGAKPDASDTRYSDSAMYACKLPVGGRYRPSGRGSPEASASPRPGVDQQNETPLLSAATANPRVPSQVVVGLEPVTAVAVFSLPYAIATAACPVPVAVAVA